jgi:hypothetical protein
VSPMTEVFNPKKGRLTEIVHPESERRVLVHLFGGAIGSYENPHSHRTVNLTAPREAQEQVLLALRLWMRSSVESHVGRAEAFRRS